MQITFLDTATMGESVPSSMVYNILKIFGNVEVFETSTAEEAKARIKNTDIIITNKVKLTEDVLSYAENVKMVCICATGFDNVDKNYCKQKGIQVRNVKGYSTDSVAQVTVSMVLALENHILSFDKYVKSGSYTQSGIPNYLKPVYHEFSGMRWGIIGYGEIGKRVSEIARVLGADVVVYSKSRHESVNNLGLDELCRTSDIITVHVPLCDETYHLINSKNIKLMKKSAVVVNVARGAVVDEAALAEAVIDKKIAGIGIDVYSSEPMTEDSPYQKLIEYDNVILTPHMAWGSHEARVRCIEEVACNIHDYTDGGNRNRIV